MKKLLLISIAFPPKGDPESLQVGRYVKYLSKFSYQINAITSANPTLYMEVDQQLEHFLNDVNQIKEIRLIENRYLNFLLRNINPAFLQYPDPKFSFWLSNPKVEKPDLIYSRSYPVSSTLMALKFKKKWPDIPWVLHLSDPWVSSYEGDSPATNFKFSSRKWNKNKEEECFALADRISFTSEKTIELYSRNYPHYKNKFILSPNVYDDDVLNISPVSFNDKLNVVYTGGFGEKRDPSGYLSAIDTFLKQNDSIRNDFRFVFTGPMTLLNKQIFDKYLQIPEIMHLGVVDYEVMIAWQQKSHILVNIDSDINDPHHSVFFPSKLLEYMAANRRIMAITNTHSVTHQVIHQQFGDSVEFNQQQPIIDLIVKYYKHFKQHDASFFTLNKGIGKYSARLNSERLIQEFDFLLR